MKSSSVLEAKFLRSQTKATLTKLWKEVEPGDKSVILNAIDFLAEEIIVIYFKSGPTYWWLFTNQRLIISEDENITHIPFASMRDVDARMCLKVM